jgi:hypothetical protein
MHRKTAASAVLTAKARERRQIFCAAAATGIVANHGCPRGLSSSLLLHLNDWRFDAGSRFEEAEGEDG